MKATEIHFAWRGFNVNSLNQSCSKINPFLKRCRYHLLWNVLPTFLMLVAVGWVSLVAIDRLDGSRKSDAGVAQRNAG